MFLIDIIGDIKNFFTSGVPFYLHQFLRTIIGFLDGLIYTADAEIYDLMFRIADARVFTDTTITEIAGRVYQLIALIMMFRLIFTFINYVINPDDLVDKKKGLGNIAKKIVITLALIIVTPWAFMQSRRLQTVVFNEGVIEYFVFGQNVDSDVTGGYRLMRTVGKLFITPYKCLSAGNCGTDSDAEKHLCEDDWDAGGGINDECGYGRSSDTAFDDALKKSVALNGNKYDLGALTSLAQYGEENGKGWNSDFFVDYKYPFIGTTLIGIVIGYILISMCIDIAVRSVKLSFYEIISPIPIISNIGPKDGKDSLLNKWFSEVLKTYLDLFIRILGLQMAILFIDMMIRNGVAKNDLFSSLFLLVGALLFAKKLPDILKSLGIKVVSGDGGFSIKKKLQPAASMLRPLTGAMAGAVGGIKANTQASNNIGRGKFKTSASALGGAVTGAFRGGVAGAKQKNGLGMGAGFSAAGKSGQKIVKNYGTSRSERLAAGVQQRLGLDTEADKMQRRIDYQDKFNKAYDALQSYTSGKQNKNQNAEIKNVKYRNAQGQEVVGNVNRAQARARLDALKNGANVGGIVRNVTYQDPTTGQMVTRDVNLDSIGQNAESRRTELAMRSANLNAQRTQGYQSGTEVRESMSRLSQMQANGFSESTELKNDRATLFANRAHETQMENELAERRNRLNAQSFQESANLANDRAALANERNHFQADAAREIAFTYHNEATGQDETRSMSINELESRLQTAISNGWSDVDQTTLRNAIEANRAAQAEEAFADRENQLEVRRAQEEVTYNSNIAREQIEIQNLESNIEIERSTNNQKEREINSRETQEKAAYDSMIARAKQEVADAQRAEAEEKRKFEERLAEEERLIAEEKRKITEEDALYAAAKEAQKKQVENEMIELNNQLAAADKQASAEYLDSKKAKGDSYIKALVDEMNEAARRGGLDDNFATRSVDMNNIADSAKAIHDQFEAQADRYSDEYRRAQRAKEASKPKK